jgi:hypothetical protein
MRHSVSAPDDPSSRAPQRATFWSTVQTAIAGGWGPTIRLSLIIGVVGVVICAARSTVHLPWLAP